MGCKAQNAAIAVAIASICNATDRPIPQVHTARWFVQRIPRDALHNSLRSVVARPQVIVAHVVRAKNE